MHMRLQYSILCGIGRSTSRIGHSIRPTDYAIYTSPSHKRPLEYDAGAPFTPDVNWCSLRPDADVGIGH